MTVKLTPRQQQVCDLLALGYSTKEAAVKLGISWRTVDEHRGDIFKRYGVRNQVHLVRMVYGLGAPPARKSINA